MKIYKRAFFEIQHLKLKLRNKHFVSIMFSLLLSWCCGNHDHDSPWRLDSDVFDTRCTLLFPWEVEQDHTTWTIEKDSALVRYVDTLCHSLSTSPSCLVPDELNILESELSSQLFAPLQGMELGLAFEFIWGKHSTNRVTLTNPRMRSKMMRVTVEIKSLTLLHK